MEIMVISEALFNLALTHGGGKKRKEFKKDHNVMISGLRPIMVYYDDMAVVMNHH